MTLFTMCFPPEDKLSLKTLAVGGTKPGGSGCAFAL
jgi:hypothetical protein